MNLKYKKLNLLAIAAIVTAAVTMSFKLADQPVGTGLAPTTLFYHGSSTTSAAAVTNAGNWTNEPNSEICGGSLKPCSMDVDPSDTFLNSNGKIQLDPSKVTLGTSPTSGGNLVPTSPDIDPHNRN